jgi:PAS domain S-box-containing protein
MTDHRIRMPDGAPASSGIADRITLLEKKETALWRTVLLLVVFLTIATALFSWETLRTLPQRAFELAEGLPALTVTVVLLTVLYVWRKKQEFTELRGFVRGMQQRAEAPPSEAQLDRLFEIVAQSQQGYRELIDSFDDVVFTVSLDGRVRTANRSFADLLGVKFPGFIGHRLDEFIEEPSLENVLAHRDRFVEKRQWAGTLRIKLRFSGGIRFFDCSLQAILKDGQVTGASCLARDVTQQREAEMRFTELFETLQEGIYFTTPEGEILDANPALVRLLGYDSKEELLRVQVGDLFVDPGMRMRQAEELRAHGQLKESEIVLRRKDGQVLHCLDTSTAIRDSSGKIIRFQGALTDITERRRMEQKLHEEQEFARRLVNSFPDLIVVIDAEKRYRFVSPSIEELLGYKPEDLVGRVVGERSHPEDKVAMDDLCRNILSGKETFVALEYRTQHRDGSWRVFRAAASPLYDTEGNISGLVASSRDFTELKRLEQQVIQSEKMAAMGQLIAGVAHELNNPLTAILGISDLLRERAASEDDRRQLDLVHQQTRRAADIVSNLLAFSRPAKAQKVPLCLTEMIQRTLQLHEYSLRVNNIVVDFSPESHLPAVLGDSNQLMQVFLNLIVNAEQAIRSSKNSGILRVRTGAREGMSGPTVWASIEDDGPGIPPDSLPRIFDPFFTTKRPGRGTGLGLSICMALVKEHGGTLEASNAPAGGALFTLTLPAVQTQAGAEQMPRLTEKLTSAPDLSGRSILVVDDEASIRELIVAGLSTRGVRVECAASGDQALLMVQAAAGAGSPYDAILCDVKMPGLSGERVFTQLAGQPVSTSGPFLKRFIFMTGDLVDQGTMGAVQQSGVRCVQKPFRVADLVAVLRETFQG